MGSLGAALLEFAAAQLLEAAVAEVSSRAVRRVVDRVAGEEPRAARARRVQLSLPLTTGWASSVRSHVPGRVRLHVPALRDEPGLAAALEARIERVCGVHRARATALTGNVLVEYDPTRVTLARIRAAVEPGRPRTSRVRAVDGRQLRLAV